MRRLVLTLGCVAVLGAVPARAADHVVSRTDMTARLSEARQARAADVAVVQDVLATPRADAVASRLGADVGRVRAAVASLNDAELRDLAQRARALRGDPAAGIDKDIHDLLVIFIIVAIVILVLQAVD